MQLPGIGPRLSDVRVREERETSQLASDGHGVLEWLVRSLGRQTQHLARQW